MAGSRQHTIPRWLQKGFASGCEGDDVFVWMYRKGSQGIEVNTMNVGVDRDFYGKPGAGSLDERITSLETDEYSSLVDDFRALPSTRLVDDQRIPNLISHLCLRTRSLRQSTIDVLAFFIAQLHDHFRDPEVIRAAALNDRLLREVIQEQLVAHGIDSGQTDNVMSIIKPHIPDFLEQFIPNVIESIDRGVLQARSNLPKTIRDSHIDALAKSPAGQAYGNLQWFLVVVNSPLVLGDTACVFETTGQRRFKPLNETEDELHAVFLPVSSDRLLLGTPYRAHRPVDVRVLNKACVRCSYEYFLSPVQLPLNSPLVKSIGHWSGILNQTQLRSLINEVKSEWPPKPEVPDTDSR